MSFTFSYERSHEDPKSSPVTIGWFYGEEKTSVVYFPPERLRVRNTDSKASKSASRCPAIINIESRYAVIRCPFDLQLGFVRDSKGVPRIRNLLGDKSPIRNHKLGEKVVMIGESEWRFENRPTIQFVLPYVFISDEPVYISQISPYLHYRDNPLPGTIFAGRFPIDVWPRQLMWAFEWHNTNKPIILKRGEPLFYAQFETDNPERSFQLVEAEVTPELKSYLNKITAAVGYVNQTFSLFKEAARMRPKELLKPVKR